MAVKLYWVKPPKSALILYFIGFGLIGASFLLTQTLNQVQVQQLLIAGAIVVAIGSMINWVSSIRKDLRKGSNQQPSEIEDQ